MKRAAMTPAEIAALMAERLGQTQRTRLRRDSEVRRHECCGRIDRSGSTDDDRSFAGVLSTDEVARDGHRVFAWTAPDSVPLVDSHRDADGIARVLGRVSYIRSGASNAQRRDVMPAPLHGIVTFAPADVNPAAEVAFRLYQAGICDALSVSFIPIEATRAAGRGRAPGAMDISLADLCEVSVVAVPSDVNAKVIARALRSGKNLRDTIEGRRLIARALQTRTEDLDMSDRLYEDSPYGRSLREQRARDLQDSARFADDRRVFGPGVGLARDNPVAVSFNFGDPYKYPEGHVSTPAPTQTLSELGIGRAADHHAALGGHLDDAIAAVKRAKTAASGTSAYGPLEEVHRCLSAAQDSHQLLGDALQALYK
jgi:hypothetical protein